MASSVHHNRQAQRASHHPTMANTKPRSTRNSGKTAARSAPTETEKENEALKLEIIRLKKRQKLDRSGTSAPSGSGTAKAMEREVGKTSKTSLWKVCKFLKNETKLNKAAKFVMEQMDLNEFDGLEGAALVEAQENWKASHRKYIRTAMNKQRNYVQQVSFGYQSVTLFANQDANALNPCALIAVQELREFMEDEVFAKKKEAEFPNVEQMKHLVMRNKLDDKTPEAERKVYEKLFDNYWNLLLPKAAGHYCWGPTKRHYCLPSFDTLDDSDPEGTSLVSASDEAFMLILWENCYDKWWYKEECKRKKEEVDEENEAMKTPFTDAKGGQKKFGGWNAEGIKKYNDICSEIEKNRVDEAEYIKAVEESALERIQKAEKVDLEGKKKKRSSKSAEIDEDEEDDENDYTTW